MKRDLYSNIGTAPAIVPAVKTAAADGLTIDTKGFNSLAIAVTTGAVAGDGDFGLALEDSDEAGSGFAAVGADFVDNNAPATLAASSTYKLGYRGHKRFVRLQLTKAGGTSIALGAVAVLGNPADAPVA
ncbi:hypothetical protein [Devosia sp.]|uniref:hypothetical protein n=1 Tax=Devosia sp. TaxID=1871048 RepID=UPI001AC226FD|nr:hypothetical protein [Devosia sp.]MBN9335372.1 hypothetical protein [Devosia sp.]